MARARKASDEIYNERRRLRRAAARAEKKGEFEDAYRLRRLAQATYVKKGVAGGVSDAARVALAAAKIRQGITEKQIRAEMRAAKAEHATGISAAKAARRGSKSGITQAARGAYTQSQLEAGKTLKQLRAEQREKQEANAQSIRALREIASRPSVKRGVSKLARALSDRVEKKDRLFIKELNMASIGTASTLDRPDLTGKSQARIFWMSTQKIWRGDKPEERYEHIKQALGVRTVEEAFNIVMEQNERAIDSAIKAEAPIRSTIEDMQDETADIAEQIGSPPEFMYYVQDITSLLNLMA